jgi:hypothetical protein
MCERIARPMCPRGNGEIARSLPAQLRGELLTGTRERRSRPVPLLTRRCWTACCSIASSAWHATAPHALLDSIGVVPLTRAMVGRAPDMRARCLPDVPRGHREIARSLRAENLEQVAHSPRDCTLPGKVALSPRGEVPTLAARKQDRLSHSRIQACMLLRLRNHLAIPRSQELLLLHVPVYPCKENRLSINAMYYCEALHGGNKSVSVVIQPNAPQLDYQLDRAE